MDRRTFLQQNVIIGSTLGLAPLSAMSTLPSTSLMNPNTLPLSLSQWALHRTQFGRSKEDYEQWKRWLATTPTQVLQGELDPLDFPSEAKQMGFDAVEYVNTFFYRQPNSYFEALRRRCDEAQIKSLLIMVDEEGMLGDPDPSNRKTAIDAHRRWLEAASTLGCHSIRVNAHSKGPRKEQQKYAAEGLAALCEIAATMQLDILIENHGGMSSHPEWLVDTIKAADQPNLGTMVDFDNFDYSETQIWNGADRYNRYLGVELLMPYAKSVSAKAHRFDDQGFETSIDFKRMIQLIKQSNFEGYISVEYEGNDLSERAGVEATRTLLEQYL